MTEPEKRLSRRVGESAATSFGQHIGQYLALGAVVLIAGFFGVSFVGDTWPFADGKDESTSPSDSAAVPVDDDAPVIAVGAETPPMDASDFRMRNGGVVCGDGVTSPTTTTADSQYCVLLLTVRNEANTTQTFGYNEDFRLWFGTDYFDGKAGLTSLFPRQEREVKVRFHVPPHIAPSRLDVDAHFQAPDTEFTFALR